jgi:hypothetical protein
MRNRLSLGPEVVKRGAAQQRAAATVDVIGLSVRQFAPFRNLVLPQCP